MPRKKGTPKTGGRVRGTPNHLTTTLREFIIEVLNTNRNQFIKDIRNLDEEDRVKIYISLLKFVVPISTTDEIVNVREVHQGISVKEWIIGKLTDSKIE